ncbi:hypothetical protein ACIQ9P_25590 [Kitasatospora sp. NPDC094019]|uniref:hypothetical protein n=1 Tax=Kitasatospora sp. NPDC094019 TaxID=3364091 RepID=UPI0038281309
MVGSWYVVLEEETERYASIDGHGYDLYRWDLTRTVEVEGDRAAAETAALALADSYVPERIARFLNPGGRPERNVYRLPDGTLLVRMKRSYDEIRFRIGVGELISAQEEIEGERRPERPNGLKRLFGQRGARAGSPIRRRTESVMIPRTEPSALGHRVRNRW